MIVYCPRCGGKVLVSPVIRTVKVDTRERGTSCLVVEFDTARPDHRCDPIV